LRSPARFLEVDPANAIRREQAVSVVRLAVERTPAELTRVEVGHERVEDLP